MEPLTILGIIVFLALCGMAAAAEDEPKGNDE